MNDVIKNTQINEYLTEWKRHKMKALLSCYIELDRSTCKFSLDPFFTIFLGAVSVEVGDYRGILFSIISCRPTVCIRVSPFLVFHSLALRSQDLFFLLSYWWKTYVSYSVSIKNPYILNLIELNISTLIYQVDVS